MRRAGGGGIEGGSSNTVCRWLASASPRPARLLIVAARIEVKVEPMLMAWHPRQDRDPAHGWLRDTVKRVVTEPRPAQPPLKPRGDRPVGPRAAR